MVDSRPWRSCLGRPPIAAATARDILTGEDPDADKATLEASYCDPRGPRALYRCTRIQHQHERAQDNAPSAAEPEIPTPNMPSSTAELSAPKLKLAPVMPKVSVSWRCVPVARFRAAHPD